MNLEHTFHYVDHHYFSMKENIKHHTCDSVSKIPHLLNFFEKMDFNIPQFFLKIFIILQVVFSDGFAFLNNSPVEVNRKLYEAYQTKRFGNRNVLGNSLEFFYSSKAKDKDTINQFQPLLIDYTLFQYFYVESSNFLWNPIHSFELLNAKFYFVSSALIQKEREQVFTDFYIKYNAAFAFLHFWITRFVIKNTILKLPEDKAEKDNEIHRLFLSKCDEMAFYAYWFVDLEIDRHLDEIDLKLRSAVPKNRKFYEVIKAFETIIKTLRGLIEIEPFVSPIRQRIFKFNQKTNPFNSRIAPLEIEQQKEKWMRIVEFAEVMKNHKNPYIKSENFFKNWYTDDEESFNTKRVDDLRIYMQNLHDYSWSAIDMVLGKELFIMESFFYTTLTGMRYSLTESFIRPEFSFTKKLWKELECIYTAWNPVTVVKNKTDNICKDSPRYFYSKDSDAESQLYLIRILREMDNLRFNKHNLINLNVKFTLKTCSECFFHCRCIENFRMVAD